MIETIAAALEQRGYSALTPVQAEVTKPEYDGADLLVSAQTGSGKTVGFGLAIAPTLLGEKFAYQRPRDLHHGAHVVRGIELGIDRPVTPWLFGRANQQPRVHCRPDQTLGLPGQQVPIFEPEVSL